VPIPCQSKILHVILKDKTCKTSLQGVSILKSRTETSSKMKYFTLLYILITVKYKISKKIHNIAYENKETHIISHMKRIIILHNFSLPYKNQKVSNDLCLYESSWPTDPILRDKTTTNSILFFFNIYLFIYSVGVCPSCSFFSKTEPGYSIGISYDMGSQLRPIVWKVH